MVEFYPSRVTKCECTKYQWIAVGVISVLLFICLVAIIVSSSKSTQHQPSPSSDSRFRLLDANNTCFKFPATGATCRANFRPLVVISLDGFRHDYLQRYLPSNSTLRQMIRCGVSTDRVRPVFPTKTFPNHYSIVTGMYPESSGIIGNTVRDPELPGRKFRIGKKESFDPVWWLGEPIWLSAEKAGLRSAVFYWPGSEVRGRHPSTYRRYDDSVSLATRLDQVLRWLAAPPLATAPLVAAPPRAAHASSSGFHLVLAYYEQPDRAGHKYGPDSQQVRDAIQHVDAELGLFMERLYAVGLMGCVDMIVTSDHGMTRTKFKGQCNSVVLSDIVPGLDNVSTYINGPITRIRPYNESEAAVSSLVSRLDCRHPSLRVMQRRHTPARWHFWRSRRIEPIVAQVDSGALMRVGGRQYCQAGTHGYDNDLPNMQNIFIGYGPSFKSNYTTPAFDNIQIRSLMETLLGLPHGDNNSTKHSLDHLLVAPLANLSSVGSAPPIGAPITDVIEDVCCDSQSDSCNCQLASSWRAVDNQTLTNVDDNVFPMFPLPVDSAFEQRSSVLHYDNTFMAVRDANSSKYRWFQYVLSRDANGQLQLATVGDDNKQGCQLRFSQDSSDSVCLPGKTESKSLYYAPGVTTFYQLLQPTYYRLHQPFVRVIERMRRVIDSFSAQYRYMAVLTGPIYNNIGISDIPSSSQMASHFFFQLRMCNSTAHCSAATVRNKQWILPHQRTFSLCEDSRRFIDFHECHLKDVEEMTGLRLFSGLRVSSPDRLDSSHAYLSTQLTPDLKPPASWAIN